MRILDRATALVEMDRLGQTGVLTAPPAAMRDWATDLGHSSTALDSVARSVYQWDIGQAATIISYENVFVGVGILLLFIIPPALFMTKRGPAES